MEKTSDNAQVKERNERYNKYVDAITPKTSIIKSLFHSFWLGGLTCLISQLIFDLFQFIMPNVDATMIATYTLSTIITIAIFLTGIGVFDKMSRLGGAGLFLPITGFANAMSSAAMEFKTEGLILGTSTKIFSVVGPVLLNGVVWSTVVGLLHLVIFGRI